MGHAGADERGLDLSPPVLAYHKVGTPELGGTWCTRKQFARHLNGLRHATFEVLNTQAYLAQLANPGSSPVNYKDGHMDRHKDKRKSVLLTFDDAFESFAHQAWPELQAQSMDALIFVVTDFVGRRATWDLPLPGRRVRHLDWQQLRRLQEAGVEIGSHSCSHVDLRSLGVQELEHQVVDSKKMLEDRLGCRVRTISYPFGRCSPQIAAAVRDAGYEAGFTMGPERNRDSLHGFSIRRWGVYVTDSTRAVLDKIDPARAGNRFQDLYTRGINRVAGISADWSRRKTEPRS